MAILGHIELAVSRSLSRLSNWNFLQTIARVGVSC